jgi:Ca-activated chloride channel family protein
MKTAAWLALGAAVSLAPTGQRFHATIDAVRVDVLVTDGRRPVPGLTAADFELRDRGVPQVVDSVTLADVPIDMMVALDTSGSVAGGVLEQLKDGVSAAFATIGRQDRAALVAFSSEVRLMQNWTADARQLEGASRALTANGGTSLWDAVFSSLTLHEPTPGTRRLLLVFSDGDDTSSWLPRNAVVEKAKRSDAVIYAVELRSGPPEDPSILHYRPGIELSPGDAFTGMEAPFLEELADASGGTVYRTTSGELRNAFKQIVSEFRTRYVLTYQPKGVDSPGWHPIEVRLKGKRGAVRARRGYSR